MAVPSILVRGAEFMHGRRVLANARASRIAERGHAGTYRQCATRTMSSEGSDCNSPATTATNGGICQIPQVQHPAPESAPVPRPQEVLPPLPADPHPSTVHAQMQMAYKHAAAAQQYGASQFAQPVMHWQQEGFVMHHNPDIPPISSLLLREADAWRAVLNLHSATIASAQQISRSPDNLGDAHVHSESDKQLNSLSREAAYCNALSGLASQCDALFNEVLKLRTLRKARRTVEIETAAEVVRSHSDEVLAIGQTLASNGALNVSSAVAELRAAIQGQRNQVSQMRVLLECLKTASGLPLPAGAKLVVGVAQKDQYPRFRELDDLFAHVYKTSRDVNETSLSDALSAMFLNASPDAGSAPKNSRQFARRTGDRDDTDTSDERSKP